MKAVYLLFLVLSIVVESIAVSQVRSEPRVCDICYVTLSRQSVFHHLEVPGVHLHCAVRWLGA